LLDSLLQERYKIIIIEDGVLKPNSYNEA